jgi:UDPglucose--hexose-1-phosphate uridylyltransferase
VPRLEEETVEERESCPFCEGREARTPPETLALGRDSGHADAPGWRVRVVPNLYPAFERQEVVIHSPRHARTFAELEDAEVRSVADAWRLRVDAARADGFVYVHALVNEGRLAGASLPHSHSQLVWMRRPPPEVLAERAGERLARLLAEERTGGTRVVLDPNGLLLTCPYAGRGPYELLIAPLVPEPDAFDSGLLAAALLLLREGIRRLRVVEGPVPWNAWVHTGDAWHLHVLPRLSVQAGIELGAGIYVNTLPPEAAAAALRDA